MAESGWQFFIDVGGTFTDAVARRPDGSAATFKLLSDGTVRGVVGPGSSRDLIVDPVRRRDPTGVWDGYHLTLTGGPGVSPPRRVRVFDGATNSLHLKPDPEATAPTLGATYELRGGEEAPIAAIRYLMGLRPSDPIGPVEVRLGTTRATNALLERKGARTALVTTLGFADVLRIGYQDRPALFDLHIRKREELAAQVVEIDERLSAGGQVLRAPESALVRRDLEALRAEGIESLAICLLHAHVNPAHERLVADIAEAVGFRNISVSSRVAPMERIVTRGDTTVVDAYLSPVIREYVAALRHSLPEARLLLMTSNGGLVEAEAVCGKDTLLSGPAGGVVGCAAVAKSAAVGPVIGFDMGGTSTDVCRVDPPPASFEYEHETVKAGVRLVAPMLAVETVAAGGGSICCFDGQMLRVGPHSAGADPGPACYGRGGPLTITDVNLYLGRIVPEFFPFRLDAAIVERRLADLGQVVAAGGKPLSPLELAEGFAAIANSHMAETIKRISVAKGCDVREYALNCFGGAGGQHACAVAELLGIRRICLSPYAGVLSALGIGMAEIKRIAERSVRVDLDESAPGLVEAQFAALENELRDQLRAAAGGAGAASPVRTWDVCYVGQSSTITVAFDSPVRARANFEREHRRLYGYTHDSRPTEIRAVRVEMSLPSPERGLLRVDAAAASPGRPRTTRLFVDGRAREVPLFLRSDLSPGRTFSGPALVLEDTSTVVVDAGWHAEVLAGGELVLEDRRPAPGRQPISVESDPIQLELFNQRFAAIAEQMGVTLRRTALSTNVKERLDFSCAVFTAEGDLVVNAPHIPVHLGGMSDCVKALIEDVREFAPGDVYVTNDPYRGGSHLNDVTVVTAVHEELAETMGTPRLLFFVASRAHHAEIGGTRPGSMPPDSRCLAEEGVLIRAFRWVHAGAARHEELRALLCSAAFPSRAPQENLADIAAQAAANQTGVRELQALVARCGLEVVRAYMGHIRTAAERKMRAALRRLGSGVYRSRDQLDDGSPICVAFTVDGDRARLDFTGTGAVLPGNLNANRSIVTSAVMYCLRCLIDEDIPLNSGVLAPVEIVLPECLLNPSSFADPARCPAIVGGNVETSQRVVDCLFGALGIVAASQGTMNNVLMGNERFGYYETICGGAGAGRGFDGADAVHTHMTNTRLTDPELLESRYPVRLVQFHIRRGSGGAGRWHGGDGVVRELEFLEPLEVSILSQRRTTAPYGVAGGGNGQPGRNLLLRVGASAVEVLPPIAHFPAAPGDRLVVETPGGGGYGTAP
ncbi:MAG: hydantoinase B/oxoprolinase family protein [Planctomycetes bacterium]|nr:hydantoinase B/oxoprolinase family protein [Planctomycetota bacterium]